MGVARRRWLGCSRRWSSRTSSTIASFDETAAGHYADIVVRRERAGRPIGTADAQIAAICRSHDAVLATRNTSDFTDTGAIVVNPWTEG